MGILTSNTQPQITNSTVRLLNRATSGSYAHSVHSVSDMGDSIDKKRCCLPIYYRSVNDLSIPMKEVWPWKRRYWVLLYLSALGGIAALLWLILFMTLPRYHLPHTPSSGINYVVEQWKDPSNSSSLLAPWRPDFTKNIVPLSCHSHNDYWRSVPLFEAVAAGCTGVEADIWLNKKSGSDGLLVGHSLKSLRDDRTLQNLYVKPLLKILENQNINSTESDESFSNLNGVFQSNPNATLTLVLDFKSDGPELWPLVNQELEALRSNGWLTNWSNSTDKINWRPIIVVATGNAPFDLLISNTTYRDVFYDAPLKDIANPKYNQSNSYYASVSMSTLGKIWLWKFSSSQLNQIKTQVAMANAKGLKARYWDTPALPVIFREYIWGILVENGVGMLNVDVFPSSLFYLLVTRFGQNRVAW
ncbi:uncharacterized protein EAE97_011342 [Botrytis byssoidea]|uniref:Altered inheritance of mitochondria protein 6 n=1 Tax=Botrytis byssoidea TaxID=139641 RepID=A0A9P5HUS9_9HELO|nr:uncharacterized protein EAE97_011342 [Botrytis byssoidea]KAF7921074.1 hypothetical protein EAE97_011342 [Botrytis byssoidea]